MIPRPHISILYFTLLLCFACNSRSKSDEVWTVIECKHAGQLFKVGEQIVFLNTHVRILSAEPEQIFPIVSNNDQLIINTGDKKWLFQITRNDSVIVLAEHYEDPEAIITLKIISP